MSTDPDRPHVVELFAGCGGLATGLSLAGFRHVALVERDRHACDTLRANASVGGWPEDAVLEANVQEIGLGQWQGVDLLAAGVPCQPFSHGGLGNGHADTRNLFPVMLDAIRATRPRAILVENVFGLLRPTFKDYFAYILDQLRLPSIPPRDGEDWTDHWARVRTDVSLGNAEYIVDYRALEAADLGTAQRRRRVFILAIGNDVGSRVAWPAQTHSRERLVWDQSTGAYWDRHGLPHRDVPDCISSDSLPWRTVRDALADLGVPVQIGPTLVSQHVFVDGARTYDGHTGSSLDGPSKTIKAGVHGVAGGEAMLIDDKGRVRYYTIREAARLQDFDDAYVFPESRTRAMRQIGNAVPVRLATALGESTATMLSEQPQ